MTEQNNEDNFFLISLDKIDATQRTLVQAQVDLNAISWWHQQENVWVVQGGTRSYWLNILTPFVTGITGNVYIFDLPGQGERRYAAYSIKSRNKWLRSTYMGLADSEAEELKSLPTKPNDATP